MPSDIRLHDLSFQQFISHEQIQQQVQRMANELYHDLKNEEPLFIPLLNGAFIFAADLVRAYPGTCAISFVKLSSYSGIQSGKLLTSHIGLNESIQGRTLVILEDVIDTGFTLHHFIQELKKLEPEKILLAALLVKPHALEYDLEINYHGFNVGNEFLVGYGLDYDGLGRNLKDIYAQVNH